MPNPKDILKNGWHPSKESFTKDNLRAGPRAWLGKSAPDDRERAQTHQSRPLDSLKDPDSFGPPPKKTINYNGGAASTASSQSNETADQESPRPPPVPYRLDTTGLSTSQLPKPPKRDPNTTNMPPALPARQESPTPSLPPRLPQRTRTQDAPPPPIRRQLSAPPAEAISASQASTHMTELQSRFKSLNTTPDFTPTASQGTTWAQKQAAITTISNAHQNPSSVSVSDLRSTAATANVLRQRHGDQVASVFNAANSVACIPSATATEQTPSPTTKKGPPPPPAKRKDLLAMYKSASTTPPPVPLSSKPKT